MLTKQVVVNYHCLYFTVSYFLARIIRMDYVSDIPLLVIFIMCVICICSLYVYVIDMLICNNMAESL